ncbi:MAG: radical SAM family heme chaperone HemW [Kiritimatiellia bacterium]
MNDTLASAVQHLYVHVPFCDGKCDYCGFYSGPVDEEARRAFARMPGRELRLLAEAGATLPLGAPRTIYFGGGTPAMLGEDGLREMVSGLREVVSFAEVGEWTLELNPAGVTRASAAAWRDLGVNRVSLGAQCFDDEVLRRLGRRNTVQDVIHAVEAVRAAGFVNIGLDLIAGLPGVAPERWRASLEHALALDVSHVSVYALNVEAGTPLAEAVEAGTVILPDAEVQLAALAVAEEVLGAAGLARYEISNYARPGHECRHNLACWRGEDYIGLGPSASSRAGLWRWTNDADLSGYARGLLDGRLPPRAVEEMEPQADAEERLVFGMRLMEGVNPAAFAGRYPAASPRVAEWQATLMRLERQMLTMRTKDGSWRLTARGREVADAVVAELV